MAMRSYRFFSVALLALVAGCAAEVERRGEAEDWGSAVVAGVAVSIGLDEGAPEYLFGNIRSVAADRDGRIYVADRIGSTLRVYDPDGRFLRQLGREGQGPGEYQWPADLTFGPDGRLYVRDSHRITVLAATAPGAIPDSVAATWRIPGYGNLSSRRSRVDLAGRYYYPTSGGSPRSYFYLVFDHGEHGGDTVHVPKYRTLAATGVAFYRLGSTDGRIVEGLSHAPFEPVAAWDITPRGTVIGGDASDHRVLETSATGDSIGALASVRVGLRPVPHAEWADSGRALQARIDSLPVPLSEILNTSDAVRTGELPDSLPAFRSVHLAIDGDIWIERWPLEGEGDRRFFDRYAPDGSYRGAVVLSAPLLHDPPPFFTGSAVYGIVRDPETDVERVVKLMVGLEP
jgi:hypothetical protein